jgi:hypothetical protein
VIVPKNQTSFASFKIIWRASSSVFFDDNPLDAMNATRKQQFTVNLKS